MCILPGEGVFILWEQNKYYDENENEIYSDFVCEATNDLLLITLSKVENFI